MLKSTVATLLLLLGMLPFWSCEKGSKPRKFRIGFSQCSSDEWRSTMVAEVEREIELYGDAELIFRQANANDHQQIKQIEELLKEDIDLLLVSPNSTSALTPVIEKAFKSGLPVVVIDRRINSSNYTAFVGASNVEIGQNAARYAVNLLEGKGSVFQVSGFPGATPFVDREKGFMDIISKFSSIKYVGKISDVEPDYKLLVRNAFRAHPEIDLVFAQTDYIALEVFRACHELGIDKKVKIIGVDGLPSDSLGMGMVAAGRIKATVLYPTGGQEAVQTGIKILEKKPFTKENTLATIIIDSSNVRMLKLQSDKLKAQQSDIARGRQKIQEQLNIASYQSFVILIISVALGLALILGSVLLYYLKQNRKINRRLELQNEEIALQRNQVTELMEKLKEALDAKSTFFTNVSHEFRTPLTLILSPIEELLENPRISASAKQTIQLVQKNVTRLYRLVNQLMDFRKIEENKMQVRVSENDLVAFTKEITDAYNQLAKKKGIDLTFHTTERVLPAWFDVSMFDKVIFNLLSNAFKFTRDNGYILVSVSKNNDQALIEIEDNGVGMTQNAASHAFEPFFQGEYENYKGSGLGLALSKKFMDLHSGTIEISSEKGKGTRFKLRLPLGNSHFSTLEMSAGVEQESLIAEDAKMYTAELLRSETFTDSDHHNAEIRTKEQCVLVVEDDKDLRQYLTDRLKKDYFLLNAGDGNTALNMALDHLPDLVICDVVIPGRNGLELTQMLKKDVRTAHIPVILLTSRTNEKQKLEGMATEADAYITKPFSFSILEKTIANLIASREKLKSHYASEVFTKEKQQAEKKTDRKFISEFSAVVENNIANEAFSIDDICVQLGISKVQLYRKINTLLHCSVNDYIISTRLQKAKHYLLHENLSVSEIAEKTGFGSSNYFSTVFKSKFGVTPSEMKKKGGV